MKKENVLMIANTDTALNGFLIISKMLYSTDKYLPIILCDGELQIQALINRNAVDAKKIVVVQLTAVECGKYSNVIVKIYREIGWRMDKNILFTPFSLTQEVGYIKKRIKCLEIFYQRYSPKGLIVYTDRRGGYEQAAIYLAKKKNIPVVIPSVSKVYFQQFFINSQNGVRFGKDKRLPILYMVTRKINPKWVTEYKGDYVFFMRAQELLAAKICGLDNKNPWVIGETNPQINANSDIDSYYETIKFLGEDKTRNSLVFSTSVEEIAIEEAKNNKNVVKEKISKKYSINDKKFFVFSAVPYYEAGISSEEYNIQIHEKLIQLLAMQEAIILVSLHPKMKRERYAFLEKIDNVVIIEEPLREIMCCADLFVGMEQSATRQWAEMLGLRMVMLPEKWFREAEEKEIFEFIDNIEKYIIIPDLADVKKKKLNFRQLLFSVLEGNDVSHMIKAQFDELNI